MNQLTVAELSELRFLAVASMDTQFQYWVWVTFAAVVAGFVAGNKLSRELRYLSATLYLLAAFVLIARFQDSGMTAALFQQAVVEAGIPLPVVGWPTIGARYLLFGLGTLSALYFLFRAHRDSN